MSDNLALGIDLGGSKIYAVVTDADNKVIADAKTPTNPSAGPEQTANTMKETALAALSKLQLNLSDITYFGAAIPSPVDPLTGDCLYAVNLGWKKVSMLGIMKKTFGRDFKLGNDGNLGQLGEHFCGAAKEFHSSVGFFIGTGLGGGIVIEDRLLTGNQGLAGELARRLLRIGTARSRGAAAGGAVAAAGSQAQSQGQNQHDRQNLFHCLLSSL